MSVWDLAAEENGFGSAAEWDWATEINRASLGDNWPAGSAFGSGSLDDPHLDLDFGRSFPPTTFPLPHSTFNADPQPHSIPHLHRPEDPITGPSSITDQHRRAAYIVDHLFDHTPLRSNRHTSTSSAPHDSDDFLTLGGSSSEHDLDDDEDMPTTTRRGADGRRSDVVDLTAGASPANEDNAPKRGSKRAAEDPANRAAKRRRNGNSSVEKIEEIDLVEENPSAEVELLQQEQQAAMIKAQQAAQESDEPQRISRRQCIICMESYTDASVTACGHLYCHECLTQALLAGEKNGDRGTGTCPVCRRVLSRKKKHDIIPIAFMKRAQFPANQAKRAARQSSLG